MTSTKDRLLFRADGDSIIGLGHIMRCAALSQMLKCEFNCYFVSSNPSSALILTLRKFGDVIPLISSNKRDELIELGKLLLKEDIVVIDGYSFDKEYIDFIQKQTKKTVQIDDFANGYFSTDLVINHTNSKLINKYQTSRRTKVLSGSNYLILRDEFLKAAEIKRKKKIKVDTAFICMGGADPTNVTLKVIQSCVQVGFVKNIIVVSGAAYSNIEQLNEFIGRNSEINILHYLNVDAVNLVRLIEQAEICICPSSSIALEVCCVKSGLLTGITVDNQELIHEQLVKGFHADSVTNFNNVEIDEIVLKLKKFEQVSYINNMIEKQASFADGKSGERILNEFKQLLIC
jgi:UDP-2,4-diacetamido-2,4,6-trideoxy-beta-L-altropyranose hydrolase